GGLVMAPSLFLSLRDGVAVVAANGELTLQSAQARVALRHLSPGTRAALDLIATAGGEEDRLNDLVVRTDGAEGLARVCYYLERLTQRGLVLRSACQDGERLATLVPTSADFAFPGRPIAQERPYVLSRFACTRREGDTAVLESPLAPARVVLHDG